VPKRVRPPPPNTAPCPDYDLWTPLIITPRGVFQFMRYTTVNGTEFVQQPKSTSITLATTPSTPAAILTTIATTPTSLTIDMFKKRRLAYNDATLTQLFISSNSKML
jgi:hypothetical protein